MSQYINFFIGDKNNNFYSIGSYSRNHAIYQIFSFVPYEKIVKITNEHLMKAQIECTNSLNNYNEYFKNLQEEIDTVCNFNNSVEDKIAAIEEINSFIKDVKDSIEIYNYANNFITFIRNIFDDSTDKVDIYAGIECGYPTVNDILE